LSAVEANAAAEVDATLLDKLLGDLRATFPREQAIGLVEQSVVAFRDEHGEHKQPKPLVREFFGELLRDQRRERILGLGVMLGTVHGSKGAEHDHVILLDGGWQLRGEGTWDEVRRLYYVGMTRAKQTLTLVQCAQEGAPWLPTIRGAAVHRTRVAPLPEDGAAPRLSYELLSLEETYLSFAARDPEHELIANAIHRLATGDELELVQGGNRLFLRDASGVRVGALSETASGRLEERLPLVRSVRVAAIVLRRLADEGLDYRNGLRRDTWQVVIPEITHSVDAQQD
jgi:ATP-dependent DNA helicase RecQ